MPESIESPSAVVNMQHYQVFPVNESGIPERLKKIDRWILWRSKSKQGDKVDKIPVNGHGKAASAYDPRNWLSFADAIAAYGTGQFSGIGIVLDGSDHLVCLDLDQSVNATGKVSDLARRALPAIPGYAELSVSRKGLHVFSFANRQLRTIKKPGFEFYTDKRFIAVTGEVFEGRADINDPPVDLQAAINQLETGSGTSVNSQDLDQDVERFLDVPNPRWGVGTSNESGMNCSTTLIQTSLMTLGSRLSPPCITKEKGLRSTSRWRSTGLLKVQSTEAPKMCGRSGIRLMREGPTPQRWPH